MTSSIKCMIFLLILLMTASFPFPKEKKVRAYLTTGDWYPRNPNDLKQMLDIFFKNAENKPVPSIPGRIAGLIGPHAGLVYSGQCAARAYRQLEKVPDLERVILLGLSHQRGFYGAAVGDFDYDATPLGEIPEDTDVTAQLAKENLFRQNNTIMQDEHSLEAHLPFLQYIQEKLKNTKYKIVPILLGGLDKKDFPRMAGIIKKYITPKTLVIASSDFTHYGPGYGYVPFRENIKENLTRLDMGMIDTITKMDFNRYFDYKEKTGITMCGFTPVGVLMTILKEENCRGTLIDYYKSGDRNNDYSYLSVSYASIIFSKGQDQGKSVNRGPGKPGEAPEEPKKTTETGKHGGKSMDLTKEEKKTLLTIARQTLEDHFKGNYTVLKEVGNKYQVTPSLKEKAGVFVTLRKSGDLRGCIGSIVGVEPLWEGVRNNVLNSAFQDPRFSPVKEEELKKIDIEISVMTPLQEIDDYKKIRLGTDGVVIRKGYHQAVFLPQVATETGWNLDQFLGHLCQKAGLPSGEYKQKGMEFLIFQALVFEEEELEK